MTDPQTRQEYIVVRADVYERLRALCDDDISMEQVALLVEKAMEEEDAGDPTLASYQHYRKR